MQEALLPHSKDANPTPAEGSEEYPWEYGLPVPAPQPSLFLRTPRCAARPAQGWPRPGTVPRGRAQAISQRQGEDFCGHPRIQDPGGEALCLALPNASSYNNRILHSHRISQLSRFLLRLRSYVHNKAPLRTPTLPDGEGGPANSGLPMRQDSLSRTL